MKMAIAGMTLIVAACVGVYVHIQGKAADTQAGVSSDGVARAEPQPPANVARSDPQAVAIKPTLATAPAWLQPVSPEVASPVPKTPEVNASRTARLDLALAKLQQLQATGNTNPKQIADALLQVEQANGSPVMQGVRLDVLRQNLEVAQRMNELVSQLPAAQSGSQVAPSADATIAMRAKLDQLHALQKQLRTDVLQGMPQPGKAP